MKTHTVLVMGSSRVGNSSIITRIRSPPPLFSLGLKNDVPLLTSSTAAMVYPPTRTTQAGIATAAPSPLHHLERNALSGDRRPQHQYTATPLHRYTYATPYQPCDLHYRVVDTAEAYVLVDITRCFAAGYQGDSCGDLEEREVR
jgi:hypothetical protein